MRRHAFLPLVVIAMPRRRALVARGVFDPIRAALLVRSSLHTRAWIRENLARFQPFRSLASTSKKINGECPPLSRKLAVYAI
jgi:hypothetical protein